ncbi:MAG TPA: hypothetical protein VJB11_00095 [archaeon]|nr:hypothetical protein [archaeon]
MPEYLACFSKGTKEFEQPNFVCRNYTFKAKDDIKALEKAHTYAQSKSNNLDFWLVSLYKISEITKKINTHILPKKSLESAKKGFKPI